MLACLVYLFDVTKAAGWLLYQIMRPVFSIHRIWSSRAVVKPASGRAGRDIGHVHNRSRVENPIWDFYESEGRGMDPYL